MTSSERLKAGEEAWEVTTPAESLLSLCKDGADGPAPPLAWAYELLPCDLNFLIC